MELIQQQLPISLSAFELVMNSVLQSYTSSLLPCTMYPLILYNDLRYNPTWYTVVQELIITSLSKIQWWSTELFQIAWPNFSACTLMRKCVVCTFTNLHVNILPISTHASI